MNNVSLIGRLVRDPESKATAKTEVCSFYLAIDRVGSEEADFIRVVCFGKSAEFAEQYFEKGMRVGVSGRIQTGSYTNNEGKTIYTTDVIGERLDFADGKKEKETKRYRNKK